MPKLPKHVDEAAGCRYRAIQICCASGANPARLFFARDTNMKIVNSLKSLKGRHRDNRVIRRRGRTYVINKTNRRFKARQG